MLKRSLQASAILVALFVITAQADDEDKFDAKCPVSGRAAVKTHTVAHNGGEVFFCCPNCVKAFEKDSTKHAAKANLQLVQTGQSKQEKCPLTGRAVNDELSVSTGGVKVGVCCKGCHGKVTKADEKELVAMLFGDKAFKKGFKIAKKDK